MLSIKSVMAPAEIFAEVDARHEPPSAWRSGESSECSRERRKADLLAIHLHVDIGLAGYGIFVSGWLAVFTR